MGVQKCRRTIEDAVSDPSIFKGEAILSMFKLMRNVTDMRSLPKNVGKAGGSPANNKKNRLTFVGVTTLAESKASDSKSKGVATNCIKS